MTANVDVLVGTIGRAHGLRGEVTVRPTTDFVAERFATGSVLSTGERALTVRAHRWHQGVLLVSFAEVDNRSDAEDLRGGQLWAGVGEQDLHGQDGEFHDHQLIGLVVRLSGGDVVGRVAAVEHPPAQDLLVVATSAGERLVPFVTALVPVVDLAGGFLEVVDLPGLLSDLPEG